MNGLELYQLMKWQWDGKNVNGLPSDPPYRAAHRSRINLLLHIIAVPLFLLANVFLLHQLIHGAFGRASFAGIVMTLSLAMQGVGHQQEAVPPVPFKNPSEAAVRLLMEQWITFPRFVVTGGWVRAFNQSNYTTSDKL